MSRVRKRSSRPSSLDRSIADTPVLLNRDGGTIAADPSLASRTEEALRSAGLSPKMELLSGGECAVRCAAVAEAGEPLVIVGGGDGTISAAASALQGSKTILAPLPFGTLNHFARDLGIPTDLDEAARLIAAGNTRKVDVAEMNGRVFINNSAIGLYPLMVVDRDLQQKRLGRSKRLAMVVASARTLARFRHRRLKLTINDEETARIDTPLLFVGNNDYRIDIAAAGKRESLADGQLFVLVMRKNSRLGLVAASVRALFDRSRPDDMIRLDAVETLRVESGQSSIAVSLDGEVLQAKSPITYRIRKQALRVITP